MRQIIVAGNWKMNKTLTQTTEFVTALAEFATQKEFTNCKVVIAPPYPFLANAMESVSSSGVFVSAQNVNDHDSGAYTGEVSAEMLRSLSVPYCIIGHSERRAYYHEDDAMIRTKLTQLRKNGIISILCIGETLEQRESGKTEDVILSQLKGCLHEVVLDQTQDVVIAYEPVWAIGTGRTATPQQAQEVHALIRSWLSETYGAMIADSISILYGGSVKPDNFGDLLHEKDIDGGLIGGASLEIGSYISMIETALNYTK